MGISFLILRARVKHSWPFPVSKLIAVQGMLTVPGIHLAGELQANRKGVRGEREKEKKIGGRETLGKPFT